MVDLLKWRAEFPILASTTYLVSHSMGAMPRRLYDRLRDYADAWNTRGIEAWDEWQGLAESSGDLVGRLFGAPPGTTIVHQNVSSLFNTLLSCFDWPGRDIVYADMAFPTLHYNLLMRRRDGARLRVVKSPDGRSVPTERWIEAITEKTQLVVVDHAFFRSGSLSDVAAIAKAAHDKGALICVDAYQTVGVVPIDVVKLDVDALLGGSHKWLCGGPGAAYLYVRKELLSKLEPRITGWFSHARPFGFETEEMEHAPSPRRFLGGTPGIAAMYAARSGWEIIAEIGLDAIRKNSQALTTRLIQRAKAAGLTVNTPEDPTKRAGSVCLDFDGAEAAEKELLRRKFLVDYRPKCGIRAGPHFYTKPDEVDALVDEIKKIRNQ